MDKGHKVDSDLLDTEALSMVRVPMDSTKHTKIGK